MLWNIKEKIVIGELRKRQGDLLLILDRCGEENENKKVIDKTCDQDEDQEIVLMDIYSLFLDFLWKTWTTKTLISALVTSLKFDFK